MHLLALAIAPVFLIILYIYYNDKYDKEPKLLLFYSFLLGAIVSILVTTILYVISDYTIPIAIAGNTSVLQLFIKAFFIVALIEEFSKYIIVRYFAQPNKAFNEQFDGIVYAVMVSMGFAATENIMYVLQGGIETALLRAFTAVPAHATFAVLMGYFMGKAKFSNNRMILNLLGLLLAILFHGAYDFFLFLEFIPGIWIGAFISLFIGLLLSRKAIKKHSNNSRFKDSSTI
ncbi:PrsW family glutamic-type intramembrane protease [Oceanihabitans sp. 2_MG-2023]|uniref:PrsW family intramembrane metalloprotease n=1 Tax=Oceanihabitans sp. 2_MG-2023 TaxID=3062661 RepID=UPI0026E2D76D|nr:PrsW family glutamic-type intramembrane protease [Oceanihabitans sp. 2_MG-2023]MDO6597472.1 PrsW family glutamic-type intramembrane protease [Oceanihabitans sp. 2_MG-2023]